MRRAIPADVREGRVTAGAGRDPTCIDGGRLDKLPGVVAICLLPHLICSA